MAQWYSKCNKEDLSLFLLGSRKLKKCQRFSFAKEVSKPAVLFFSVAKEVSIKGWCAQSGSAQQSTPCSEPLPQARLEASARL